MIVERELLQLITPGSGFDTYTIEHQKGVANISNTIATKMGLSNDRKLCVTLGAAFHDIGKLFLPKRLLNRNDGLSEAEYGLVRKGILCGQLENCRTSI
jgi:HD-GYP domain-containing protein (c-di-GMP phosphodiesterase class II)